MHSELCSELKLLYTAVTRAKRSLIIYDTEETNREEIARLWTTLNLVQSPQ
jgi:ATP-dependent exoDNAse (exonuclease V) alpha subunit